MEKYFEISKDCFIEDICEQRHLWEKAGVIEIVQEAGQIFFIPTGWYHQVHNLVIFFYKILNYDKKALNKKCLGKYNFY